MATKTKAMNHLHKYKRMNLARDGGKYLIFKCTKPVCTHYIPTNLAEGKLSECNICGSPFIMDKVAMTLARPHCIDCTKRRNVENVELIAKFLKEHTTED